MMLKTSKAFTIIHVCQMHAYTSAIQAIAKLTLLDASDLSWCIANLILTSTQYTRGIQAQCVHITVHGREYGGFPFVEHEQQLELFL